MLKSVLFITRVADFPVGGEHTQLEMGFMPQTGYYVRQWARNKGIQLSVIDNMEKDFGSIQDHVKGGVSEVWISSTWLPGLNSAHQIRQAVRKIRKLDPNLKIRVGGALAQKSFHLKKMYDCGSVGRIVPFLPNKNALFRRQLGKHFFFFDSADSVIDEITPRKFNLDHIDWGDYSDEIVGRHVPVSTSTGCPYKCSFCDFSFAGKLNYRSLDSLMLELKSIQPPRKVMFIDDNLGANASKLKELCHRLITEKLHIEWSCYLRADIINQEVAALLRESGCTLVALGIESGDRQILENMSKNMNPDRAMEGIRFLDTEGIDTISTFIVGFPGECERSIKNTVGFISSMPTNANHQYTVFPFLLSPLAPVASDRMRAKFKLYGIGNKWMHSTMNSWQANRAAKRIVREVENGRKS